MLTKQLTGLLMPGAGGCGGEPAADVDTMMPDDAAPVGASSAASSAEVPRADGAKQGGKWDWMARLGGQR